MATKAQSSREDRIANKMLANQTTRDNLRRIAKSFVESPEDKFEAMLRMQKKVDSSPCRQTTRCSRCKRPRAVYKHFGLCRVCLRYAVGNGLLPGVEKDSW